VIPRAVDDYFQFRGNYPSQPVEQKLGNPVHHIHGGSEVPEGVPPVTYGLLLNLVSLPGVGDRETAWKFVQRYAPGTSPQANPWLDNLIALAVNYARDFVAPNLKRRTPTPEEAAALRDLDSQLAELAADADGEAIQHLVFEIGKQHYGKENLRSWFQALYETLLGSSQGPRMGSFIALYGIENSRKLIAEALGA
jgi:lysyl-tRNA synthetase class 1